MEHVIKSDNPITKLKILTFIPIFIIGVGFLILVSKSKEQLEELKILQTNTYKTKNISQLIMDFQQERGLSSGFLGSKGNKFSLELRQTRKRVDNDYKKLHYNAAKLFDIRQKIDTLSISTMQAFSFYTDAIKEMQKYYFKIGMSLNDAYLLRQSKIYLNLSFLQEALGRIRGSFNGVFSNRNTLDKNLLYTVFHSKGVCDSSRERLDAIGSHKYLNALHKITTSAEYKYIENTVEKYASLQLGNQKEDPRKWFDAATGIIIQVADIEKSLTGEVNAYIKHKVAATKLQIIWQTTFFLLMFLLASWLGHKLKNDILRNIALLQQYKNAVDRSSIVSKTDKKGRITYANDKFCTISGYKRKDLTGKAHNIIRHPDMPKSAFRDMWNTILAKKPWTGIVKNRKKNGDFYIVEAIISPILNHKGEIEEFIAIRNNITDIIAFQEELEHTQEELIFRMGEIGERRSQTTALHVKRVALYSELLAKIYGLKEKEIKYLTIASPMHDIGKVGIPDEILKKSGKLTKQEWEVMQTHTDIGYGLFKDSQKPLLKAAAIIAHQHHEKYDGNGYPKGLKGEEIHIYGRITALADVFDALGSDRHYKNAWSDQKIFAFLKEERGKHFDPKLIDLFFEYLDEFLHIRDSFSSQSSREK